MLHTLRLQGYSNAEIAEHIRCHRSPIGRALKRNVDCRNDDLHETNQSARSRRSRSRWR